MAKVWPTGQLQLTCGLSTYPLHSHSSLGGTLDLTSFCLTRTSPRRARWLQVPTEFWHLGSPDALRHPFLTPRTNCRLTWEMQLGQLVHVYPKS